MTDEKLDSVQLEFTYMLTSQLDSQRMYFEEQLVRLDQQTSAEVCGRPSISNNLFHFWVAKCVVFTLFSSKFQRTELKEKVQKLREDNKVLESKVASLSKEKQMVDKKVCTHQTFPQLNCVFVFR